MTAKKATAKKTPAKKSPAKKATAKKTPAKKTPAKKATAKKTPAKKTAAKKTAAKKTAAKKTPAKKTAAKKSPAKKATAKKTSGAITQPRTSPIRMATPRTSPIRMATPQTSPIRMVTPQTSPTRMAPTRTPVDVVAPRATPASASRPAAPPQPTQPTQPTPAQVAAPVAPPVPPPTSSARARTGRRRRRVAVDALVCVALLVVAARAYSMQGVPDPAGPPPQAVVARVAFSPPVPVPAPGELVRTRVLPSGDLRVDHWIRSRTPITTLTATVPRVAGLAETGPVARAVRLDADGVRVSGPGEIGSRATSFRFPGHVRRVHVSYLLSGVTAISGSVSGRALARVTALDLFYAADERPKEVLVVGGDVRSLACTATTSTAAVPLACGTQEPGDWRVLLDPARRHQTVMAQVDLT